MAATIEQIVAESQAITNKLLAQRNEALDEVVRLHGGLSLRDLEISELKKQLIAAPKPPLRKK